jgi:leader peptidase (prepilin peptidase)/N-methyltransferase
MQVRGEMVRLLPAAILAVPAFLIINGSVDVANPWRAALSWAPVGGAWRPVMGITTALAGFVVAGAIGWSVRIVLTLVLGKEVLGVGNIRLMAAAGAVAGWPVAVLGFLLACPMAAVASLIWRVRRKSRGIGFGPCLSLGIVAAIAAFGLLADQFNVALERLAWPLRMGK